MTYDACSGRAQCVYATSRLAHSSCTMTVKLHTTCANPFVYVIFRALRAHSVYVITGCITFALRLVTFLRQQEQAVLPHCMFLTNLLVPCEVELELAQRGQAQCYQFLNTLLCGQPVFWYCAVKQGCRKISL